MGYVAVMDSAVSDYRAWWACFEAEARTCVDSGLSPDVRVWLCRNAQPQFRLRI